MSDTTWRQEFDRARKGSKDESPIVAIAPADIDLDKSFDDGYGGSEGEPILIWTEDHVYFPVVYDGAEWMDSVPRNPRADGMAHVGGQ